MKKAFSFLIFFIALASYSFAVENFTTQTDRPENIQVLLAKNVDEALLESKGSYVVLNPLDGSRITSSLTGKRFMLKATASGIKWGEVYPGIHQIYVVPKSKNSSLLVNGIQYEGAICVFKIKNKIHIINDVNIESYLKSTLTPQFPYPMENEVMAAITIAARTTAYSHVKRNKDAFWHVSADEIGYQGRAVIQLDSHVSNAVDRTRHIILVLSEKGENRPFAATWTENSAGKTAAFHTIFRKDWWAPKTGVEAPHAAINRAESKWSYKISKKELANLLNVQSISAVDLYTDSFSKKTYAIKLITNSDTRDINFETFQKVLGKENLLSNDLTIIVGNSDIIFTGYGKGFGVGLCLLSANLMAQHGDNAAKILAKFFPDTYLLNLSAIPQKRVK
ncbi:MAG TPA: SpoIID/LytB domain-containing protein [Chlamydiae bacterium]|nr:SpoIID/LytB domain-containing protein [Chlamydiota bacterium]